MFPLPTGTVTFLFTDIEGSTHLLQQLGDAGYAEVLADHRRLIRAGFQARGGRELETQGDGFLFVFPRARDALLAAVDAQRALIAHQWPDGVAIRVRMGLHTGEPVEALEGYVGLDIHRAARICAAGWGGQILLSDATHTLVRDEIPAGASLRDLGEHRLKDLARPLRLFQVVAQDLVADFPDLKSLNVLSNNLPIQLANFIGRDLDKAEITRLLATTRLLTLTGVGGAGKTRLALQVAAEYLEDFEDGAWFVDLAPLADPVLIPQAVASAFHVREQPGRPLVATLLDSIKPRHLLLVLDNCEHLAAACAHLAESLLRACPHLKILATSREALGSAGETVWPIPPLSMPDPQRPSSFGNLMQSEAARLFVERAQAVHPKFTVTEDNTAAIAEVCRRVDGIPLAIELAAARVPVLTVEQIAARLDDAFRLLTAGIRTLPRHQTLQAAMDWSHDLLSETERILLRRLSVFVGGFTLEAAEAVCPAPTEELDVLDLLARLVNRSLVVVEEHGPEARYRLLETVRQYTREKLHEAEEEPDVRRRYRDWYLGLAERAEPALRGPEQAVWLRRLDRDYDNIRAALDWSKTENGIAEAGLRLAWALWHFWDMRAYLSEGREWSAAMLTRASGASPFLRARVLNAAGVMAYRQGDYDGVSALCGEALTLSQDHGDRWQSALSLHYLAHVAQAKGDLDRAEEMMRNSIGLYRSLEDKWGMALSMNCLGDVARSRSQYESAAAILETSLALFRELGDQWGMALSLHNLAYATQHLGNARQAATRFRESLALCRELGIKEVMIMGLVGLAGASAGDVQPEHAARLLGAADALLAAVGGAMEPADRPEFDRNVAIVRARLGEEAFASAWAEGQRMRLEQAVEDALATAGAGAPLRSGEQ